MKALGFTKFQPHNIYQHFIFYVSLFFFNEAVSPHLVSRFQLAYYGGGAPWDTLISQFLASVLASVLWRLAPRFEDIATTKWTTKVSLVSTSIPGIFIRIWYNQLYSNGHGWKATVRRRAQVGLKLALWLCDKFSSSGSNLCIDLSKTVMIWFLPLGAKSWDMEIHGTFSLAQCTTWTSLGCQTHQDLQFLVCILSTEPCGWRRRRFRLDPNVPMFVPMV